MSEKVACRWPLFCLLVCVIGLVEGRPSIREDPITTDDPRCGYESCHPTKPNMLNVHLIPHTHDDVGWLKTVDQYYYGSETLIQKAGVQYIIDSVVDALLRDPNKRFIYVESAFFFKWWREQTSELQEKVKMLVNEGRLEFIGGAWSMNDEATTHYQSVIDQFAWGLRRLNDTFGECGRPRVGWQIDPFGHSREMASMFANMGFDGMFFGRLDYQDKDNRLMTKTPEMIWHGSANLGETSDLFTGALFNNYQAPAGFCFDILCADQPIIDGKHSPDNNVKERVDTFFKFVTRMAESYRTPNLLLTMGEDFNYQNADMWYKNLDKLIKYANERQANGSNIHLLYSTPSCYLKSLHDAGITWPTKSDDFFPYASDPHAYWTGYFTSRPTLKRYERDGNHFLQVCKQLSALAPKKAAPFEPHLTFMRETMGIMQHHDAVTGTEKQKVALDYAKRMSVAFRACGTNTRSVLNQLSTNEGAQPGRRRRSAYPFEFKSCSLLNISSCSVSESNEPFAITLYNPLAHPANEYVRVPVLGYNYVVTDYNGAELNTQVVPVPAGVSKIKHRASVAKYELIFLASDLPPVGYKTFYVQKSDTDRGHMNPSSAPRKTSSLISIGNKDLQLLFDTNGFLTEIQADGMARTISQEFLYYVGAIGNNEEFLNRSSGAYIFRPLDNKVYAVATQVDVEVYKGHLVEEVHQKFNDWISQVVRVYRDKPYAEFEWLVGPIPIGDRKGKEIVTRFKSDIQSNGVFYTDSNGREMIKRKRDHRDTWNLKLHEKIAGNYYPVTTKIALEDDTARMAILTDRAQGGSSLEDGALELMVHRRLLHDDAFGVGEPLNETEYGDGLIARGKLHLIYGQPIQKAIERQTQLETLLPPWRFFSSMSAYTVDEWRTSFKNIYTGITRALPEQVHLLTLEPWHENELLVRFEHILEKDEDPLLSKTVQFNINDILNTFNIEDIRETTLDGNAWLYDTHRMEFVPDAEEDDSYNNYAIFAKSVKEVHLLSAQKPLLATKYLDEALPAGELGAESNRLKRKTQREPFEREKPSNTIKKSPLSGDDDTKFIIELAPMQIRTFVVYLEKST
ncbi:lysosomal alpha-mannosidase-like isoform X2 [Scaptodrosophila lebanonensis]|uniref:Alpha-mannosidase n=1 Tax=Drosophila lebanonensis TaxID=7225 RepID=A0A6J2UG75_DROLE|nr:lysosomal alpha-mannosidase-like isoform X2 [Scaptodrosophila lebanonensis]